MALLTIQSTNKNLSYVLRKNPSSGLQAKPLRKGNLFAWYSQEPEFTNYHIYFRDGLNEVSYGDTPEVEFEYLSHSRYTSSLFVLHAINEFLASALKSPIEEDTSGPINRIILHTVYLRNLKYVDIFQTFMKTIDIQAEEIALNTYKVQFSSSTENIRFLLHTVCLFSLFNILKNEEYLNLDPPIITKYLQSVNVIDPPYLVRYVFKSNLLRSPKLYEELLPVLKSGRCGNVEFTFGPNSQSRKKYIDGLFSFHSNILDVGCGEGRYWKDYQKKIYEPHHYVAIDFPEKTDILVRKAKKSGLTPPKTFETLDSFLQSDLVNNEYEVLCTEVLEHMDKEEATRTLTNLLEKVKWQKMVITMPNREFNIHYGHGIDEVREEDHKYEMSRKEFSDWLSTFSIKPTEIFQFGDKIDGICPTQGALWKR